MQSDGSAHTKDTQMIMIIVSSWRELQVQGGGHKGRSEHGGCMTVKDMSGGQGEGGGRRSLGTGLKHLTGSCLLCAPQVSPDSSSPSFFISVSSVPRGCFGFSRARTTCHNAPSRGLHAERTLKEHLA